MECIGDTKLQVLGKKLKSSANEYDGLAKKYGQHRRDSAIKDYSVKHRGKQYIVRATSEKDAALKVMRKIK